MLKLAVNPVCVWVEDLWAVSILWVVRNVCVVRIVWVVRVVFVDLMERVVRVL